MGEHEAGGSNGGEGENTPDHEHHDHHEHHHHDVGSVDVAILTVSSSRDRSRDESGDRARSAFESAGHDIVAYETVPDDVDAIQRSIEEFDADVVLTSGGTGLTPDDVTVEAVRELFVTELPGVGERFRRLSEGQIGARATLSRATAGVVDGTLVYALPGSPDAVELGVDDVILPVVEHAVGLVDRGEER